VSLSEIDTSVSSPEDELVRAELDEARRKRRTGRARIVGTLVSVAVIAAVFAFALPRIADYGDVWDEIRKLSWQWLVVLGLATLLNLATYGPPLMAALPGLSYFHASRITLASTALSVIAPGGAAAGVATTVAMLRVRGFSGRPVGLAVVVMGVWNQSVILGFPILAVAGLAAQGARNRTLEIAALAGLAVFAVIVAGFAIALSSERLANRVGDRAARLVSAVGRFLHKAPVKWNGASFVHFRDESIELIRRRWLFLTAATLAGHLTVFVVLVVSLRAVGVTHAEVSIVEAFAAWTLARILGAIPITPGGVGFVELGLTGVLVAFGASNAEAVAGTMIYRVLTVVPTVLLGLVAAGASLVGRKPGETAVTNPATDASRLSSHGRSRPG
jgi:putative heme transporter